MWAYLKKIGTIGSDSAEWFDELSRIVGEDVHRRWRFAELREAVEGTPMLFDGRGIAELSEDERDGVTLQLQGFLEFFQRASVIDVKVEEVPRTDHLGLLLPPEPHAKLSKRGCRLLRLPEWRRRAFFVRVYLIHQLRRCIARLAAPLRVATFVFMVIRLALQADTMVALAAALVAGLLAAIPSV